jgi:regulatory protein
MNQPKRRSTRRSRGASVPLDAVRLEELALAYVARFATSAGKLAAYCKRKLRERGHSGHEEGASPPDVEQLVESFVARGFVDDAGFARAKAEGLLRRGYGARRVGQSLRADGIAERLRAEVAPGEVERREAAVAYARRRRFGPFAREPLALSDLTAREKQLAALLRAGHDSGHARYVVAAATPGGLDEWINEAREEEDRIT